MYRSKKISPTTKITNNKAKKKLSLINLFYPKQITWPFKKF